MKCTEENLVSLENRMPTAYRINICLDLAPSPLDVGRLVKWVRYKNGMHVQCVYTVHYTTLAGKYTFEGEIHSFIRLWSQQGGGCIVKRRSLFFRYVSSNECEIVAFAWKIRGGVSKFIAHICTYIGTCVHNGV